MDLNTEVVMEEVYVVFTYIYQPHCVLLTFSLCTQYTLFKDQYHPGLHDRKKEPVKQPRSYWDAHEHIKIVHSLDRHI